MIRKIILIPFKILRVIFMGIGVLVFIIMGTLNYFIQKKGSIDPIRYSRDGKVVELDDFRADKTGGES